MFIPVTDLNLPELWIYASANEVQLKHINEPDLGIFIAETAGVILRALNAGYEAESLLIDERMVLRSGETAEPAVRELEANENPAVLVGEILRRVGDIPVYTAGIDVLSKISGFKQTRGVLCAMKRKPLPALGEVLARSSRIAVLENVENPTNVGALFRSAAGLGFDGAVLSYRSADPLYRRAARVSMGTVFGIPWTFVGNKYGGWPEPGLEEIRKAGFTTVAMALTERSVSLDDPVLQGREKLAVFFGNEENGLTEQTLEMCDYTVKIPMRNGVDSLNVAASGAVAFWELRKK